MSSLADRIPAAGSHSPLGALLLFRSYVANIRAFERGDWWRYGAWLGTLALLVAGTLGFTLLGHWHGVDFPGYVWLIPLGATFFCAALAIDDIGHRTLYKADLAKGEGAIHQMIIATAVPSVMALCLCYQHGETFRVPALALTALSFFYSALDEAMHWYRYTIKGLDVVEMWAHFVAITGHVLMMLAWWQWLGDGYPGVASTLAALPW